MVEIAGPEYHFWPQTPILSELAHVIFREFRYLGMHILLGMIRWLVRCMSRPVQNHLDSYKMYNQSLQLSD